MICEVAAKAGVAEKVKKSRSERMTPNKCLNPFLEVFIFIPLFYCSLCDTVDVIALKSKCL
jgi:hypothetical protein